MSESTPTIRGAPSIQARLRLEVAEKLTDDIASARLAPGQKVTTVTLARRLRVTAELLEPVLPAFVETGLLLRDGSDFVVSAIDRDNLVNKFDSRLALEVSIVQKAALGADAALVKTMRHDVEMMKRCAVLGDIDGYMVSDLSLEKTIGAAANSPEEFERLVIVKREFRRAWLSYNRLRDLSEPAGLRSDLVESIAAQNPEKAKEAVTKFLNYLRRSF